MEKSKSMKAPKATYTSFSPSEAPNYASVKSPSTLNAPQRWHPYWNAQTASGFSTRELGGKSRVGALVYTADEFVRSQRPSGAIMRKSLLWVVVISGSAVGVIRVISTGKSEE